MFVLIHVHDPQVSGDFCHLFIEYIEKIEYTK